MIMAILIAIAVGCAYGLGLIRGHETSKIAAYDEGFAHGYAHGYQLGYRHGGGRPTCERCEAHPCRCPVDR